MTHTRPSFTLRLSVAAGLLLCSLASSSFAQSRSYDTPSNRVYNESTYLSIGAIGMKPDDAYGTSNHGSGWALRIGKPISPSWDLQFGASSAQLSDNGTSFKQDTVGVDGLFLFSRERLRPFVLFGLGAENDELKKATTQSGTSAYVSAGVGVQWSLGDQWGMQLDARRAHAYLDNNNFSIARSNTDSVHVGFTYAFSKPPEPAPVVRAPAPPAKIVYVETPAAPVAAPPPPVPVIVYVEPAPVAAPRFERVAFAATELFGFDSSTLKTPQPKLDEISDMMKKYSDVQQVVITGYSDRLGTTAYNQLLSQRRADSVKAYLTDKGVASDRLYAAGKGESNPVVECNDKKRADLMTCLEPNRRVEIEQFVVNRRMP